MIDENPKRFDRIVSILIQLQSKRVITAQELADRFGVTVRTIYRDIKALEASGVPLIGEAGTGYSIGDGYRLPPVMFTKEEAASFVAAEKLMQYLTDKKLGDYFQSAVYKIKSVLRWSEKEWVDLLDEKILVKHSHQLFNESLPQALTILMNGIVNQQQVFIAYQSIDATTPQERMIEPVGLYHENSFWYLLAYCHYRKEHRKFRTDRLSKVQETNKPFELQHESLAFYLQEKEEKNSVRIRLRVDKDIEKYIRRSKKYYGFVSEKHLEDAVEIDFLFCEELEYFARWFLTFGDSATILEPESLKHCVIDLLQKVERSIQ